MKVTRDKVRPQYLRHGYGNEYSEQNYDLRQKIKCTRTVEYLGNFDNDVKVGKAIRYETISYTYGREYWIIQKTYTGDFEKNDFNGQGIHLETVYSRYNLKYLEFAFQHNRFFFSTPVSRKMSNKTDIHKPFEEYETWNKKDRS